eukprot:snap_masked-scaffold_44-processed-gene-1.44-mRNA-1 protein AED:1.00 eAED:1.00 QI:0/0/0/0/1/1/3/0/176
MDSVEVLTTSRADTDSFTVTLKTGIRIKRVHSDQGTELYNQQSINFCNNQGIEFTVSAPGVPEHNGIAERSNQFILQKIRKFINATDLNVSLYWDFAAYFAVYVTNRITEGTRLISAYKKIFKINPEFKKLVIFGANVVVLKNFSHKVEQRGEFGLFLGYNHKTGEALILIKDIRE